MRAVRSTTADRWAAACVEQARRERVHPQVMLPPDHDVGIARSSADLEHLRGRRHQCREIPLAVREPADLGGRKRPAAKVANGVEGRRREAERAEAVVHCPIDECLPA
jgi:hypothetical protein